MSFVSKARKVLCIGRNYADHIKELGNAAPQQPFFFLKPTSAILSPGQGPILRPKGVKLHYELELALVLGKTLKNLPDTFSKEEALDAIDGYALGLDLTARNVQAEAKSKGLPWSIAKGFDTFLPLSDFVPKDKVKDYDDAWLELKVNGKVRQSDSTNLMIFKVPQLLAYCSNIMTLEPGDIILTGTPKGVGEIKPGDQLQGTLKSDGQTVAEIDVGVDEKPGFYEFKET